MKLKDPGTIVHPDAKVQDFFGQSLIEIKVTYDPLVGADTWYIYFDPKDFSLKGYRFYHDEEINDGEYILFEGELSYRNVRIPKQRKWYTHKEDRYLGADILKSLRF